MFNYDGLRGKKYIVTMEEILHKCQKTKEIMENLLYGGFRKTGIVSIWKERKKCSNKSWVHCGCLLVLSQMFRAQTTLTMASLSLVSRSEIVTLGCIRRENDYSILPISK